MAKKTSRAARTQQNIKRSAAARPLVSTGSTMVEQDEFEVPETPVEDFPVSEDKVQTIERPASPLRKITPPEEDREAPAPAPTPRIPSATGRTLPRRFTNPSASKREQVGISREQEYSFIRSDLLTVLALTILMVAVLVVLALFLSR